MRQSLSSTVQISASQRNPIDPNGPSAKVLWAVTPDGGFAFFTSAEELTDDANTGPADNGNDLYRYDIETGTLVDLTVDNVDANGAQVLGVLGASDDGNRVYFTARGVLAAGAVAGDTTSTCATATPRRSSRNSPRGKLMTATGTWITPPRTPSMPSPRR